jgi:hypothetical protein
MYVYVYRTAKWLISTKVICNINLALMHLQDLLTMHILHKLFNNINIQDDKHL